MHKQSLFVKIFWIVIFILVILIGFITYVIDPISYYRYDPNKPLHQNDRYQVAGFIKTFPFDIAIIGTSMTQNFSIKQISKELGGKNSIKLSIAGSTTQEQIIVAKAAIKTKKPKIIIWGIDKDYFLYVPGQYQESFPINMYENNLLSPLQYSLFCLEFNKINMKCLLYYLSMLSISKIWPISEILDFYSYKLHADASKEEYNSWHDLCLFSKEKMEKEYNNSFPINPSNFCTTLEYKSSHESKIKAFYNDFLPFIKNNPNVKFIIFFPPYSLAYHKLNNINDRKSRLQDQEFRRIILTELIKLENVRMFDFETDYEIVGDLDNYKDFTHYSKHVNAYMVEAFRSGKNLIKKENINHFQQKFEELPKLPFK